MVRVSTHIFAGRLGGGSQARTQGGGGGWDEPEAGGQPQIISIFNQA